MVSAFFQYKIPKWIIPSFFIGMTFIIIIFNDVFGEKDAYVLFSLVFFTLMTLFFIRFIFNQLKMILTLKKEKNKTELMHLKSQVNPHFFFNTLNNLYGMVGQDPEKAQELILKLSDMMRYSIYDGQHDFVSIEEEIAYLKNYIELHKMRYHKTINVTFNTEIEDSNLKIMPLLFIILVENAFKHGVENLRKDPFVIIKLNSTAKSIQFEIENNFDPSETSEDSGIGLSNLKRRLELAYQRKHTFSTTIEGNVFQAKLNIKL